MKHLENLFKRYLHDQKLVTSHKACSFHLNGYVYIVGGELDPHQVAVMNGNIFQYTDHLLPIDEPEPLCASTGNIALICGTKNDGLFHCFSFNGVNRQRDFHSLANQSLKISLKTNCVSEPSVLVSQWDL